MLSIKKIIKNKRETERPGSLTYTHVLHSRLQRYTSEVSCNNHLADSNNNLLA